MSRAKRTSPDITHSTRAGDEDKVRRIDKGPRRVNANWTLELRDGGNLIKHDIVIILDEGQVWPTPEQVNSVRDEVIRRDRSEMDEYEETSVYHIDPNSGNRMTYACPEDAVQWADPILMLDE